MRSVVDTDVISELRKVSVGRAHPKVQAWARSTDTRDLYISVITVMEIETGVLRIERRDPPRGDVLRRWFTQRVLSAFEGRILEVSVAIARRCAQLHVPDPRDERDALIAATAIVHGMTVVTRDVADFAPTGVAISDPWTG